MLADRAALDSDPQEPTPEVAELRRLIEAKDREIALLNEKIHYLVHQRFGAKSERFDAHQQPLFEPEADTAEPEPIPEVEVPAHKRAKGGRRRPPAHLPRVRIEHELGEGERRCGCGACLERIGEEVSEHYDVVPPKFQVLEHVRFTYACPACDRAPKTAAQHPPAPLPRTQASPGMLAWIGTAKFVDGLPLNRIATTLERRFEVPFTPTTLADWMIKSAERLIKPVLGAMEPALRGIDYVHIDETTVQVLDEPGRDARQKSYFWLLASGAGPPMVRLHYSPSRAGAVAEGLLAGYEGYLHTDGYSGYDRLGARPEITQLGCWAHVRRKLDAARKAASPQAAQLAQQGLALIRELYQLDKRVKDKPPDERLAHRQHQVAAHLEHMRSWLDQHLGRGLSHGGLLASAFTYLHNQWPKLVRFLEDPRLRLDNNLAERHIRPIAVGRHAWLFCRSEAGAHAAAAWYSLVETAKANGLEPYWYLKKVFEEVPLHLQQGTSLEPLLPWNLTAKQIKPSPGRG